MWIVQEIESHVKYLGYVTVTSSYQNPSTLDCPDSRELLQQLSLIKFIQVCFICVPQSSFTVWRLCICWLRGGDHFRGHCLLVWKITVKNSASRSKINTQTSINYLFFGDFFPPCSVVEWRYHFHSTSECLIFFFFPYSVALECIWFLKSICDHPFPSMSHNRPCS